MITTTKNKISYVSDGTATTYSFDFPAIEKTDIEVFVYDLNNNKTELTYGTDYSVTLNSDNSGGNVTLTNPANKDYTILIYREVPYTQETVYTENSPFPAKSHENALDKLTLLAQQLYEKFKRTLNYDPADEGQSVTLPPMVGGGFLGTTADKKLTWKANVDYSNINLKVNTIQDLLNVDLTNWDGVQPFVVLSLGYHTQGDGGGGVFYWDANEDKANHNGGTIIDPTKTFPTDWTDQTQVDSWFNTTNTGSGCWKRVYSGRLYPKWFGYTNNLYPTIAENLNAQLYNESYNTYQIILNKDTNTYIVIDNEGKQVASGADLALAFNDLKQNIGFTDGTSIKFPTGYHTVNNTFDMTNIRNTSVTFLLHGCQIISKNTGNPVFNLTASHYSLNFYGGVIIGDATNTPSYGILMARGSDGNSAGNHRFFGTQTEGNFSKSAIYLLTSETNLFYGTIFKNYANNAHAFTIARDDILGTSSQFGVTPTAYCCTTMNSIIGGYLDAEGTGGAALFIYGNVESFSVSSTYVHTTGNSSSGYQDGAIVFQGNPFSISLDNINIEGGAKYGIRFYNTSANVIQGISFNNISIFNSSGGSSDRHIYADSYSALKNFKIWNVNITLGYGFESTYYVESLYINDPSANLGNLIFSRTSNPFYGYSEIITKDYSNLVSSYYPTAATQYLKVMTRDGVHEYKPQTQPIIYVDGTQASDYSANISTGTPTGTTKKYIKATINGADYWIQVVSWS